MQGLSDRRLSTMLRLLLQVVAVLLVCVPLSLVVTFVLLPLWSWLEASYKIESVGHSGPAEWCYVLVYGILNLLVFAALWYRWNAANRAKL
jgi:phosphotransferase system  glucose/maltose/N-acetylglucosamine-specific IIC component